MLIFQILTITVFQVKNGSTISLLCCYCFFNAKNLRVGRTTLNREKKRMAWDVFTGTWYSLIFTCIISGYRLHKFELFLVGFLIAFSFSYIMCTENLSDELSGTVLEYKDQVKNLKILMIFYTWGQFQNRPCVPPPPPPPLLGEPPGIWLFSKILIKFLGMLAV